VGHAGPDRQADIDPGLRGSGGEPDGIVQQHLAVADVDADRRQVCQRGVEGRHAGIGPVLAVGVVVGPPGRRLLYVHGGGYALGSAEAFRNLASQIAVRATADAFIPDHRLAHEHPFRAAIEDVVAAYRGLQALGGTRIVVAGDSPTAIGERVEPLDGTEMDRRRRRLQLGVQQVRVDERPVRPENIDPAEITEGYRNAGQE